MKTIRVTRAGAVAHVVLARPQVRNAFNAEMIREITGAFRDLAERNLPRVAVISGEGPVFCAGADIEWMRASAGLTQAENLEDARRMNEMLRAVADAPFAVIARAHGAALGGGCGLVAAADIAIAAEGTRFGFTEARLGILPAVISTFVLPKIGEGAARRYFLTGERFDAAEAMRIGLVHEVVSPERLDDRVEAIIREVCACGPEAVARAKRLLVEVRDLDRERAMEHCARTIAEVRTTPEAQEGLRAFLEKRRPPWLEGS
jgi:methylglutaconyl-CoA hydratase